MKWHQMAPYSYHRIQVVVCVYFALGSNSSKMSTLIFSIFGKAGKYVTAFPKNAGNSLHQKC